MPSSTTDSPGVGIPRVRRATQPLGEPPGGVSHHPDSSARATGSAGRTGPAKVAPHSSSCTAADVRMSTGCCAVGRVDTRSVTTHDEPGRCPADRRTTTALATGAYRPAARVRVARMGRKFCTESIGRQFKIVSQARRTGGRWGADRPHGLIARISRVVRPNTVPSQRESATISLRFALVTRGLLSAGKPSA